MQTTRCVRVNVGGTVFETTRHTLQSRPSFFRGLLDASDADQTEWFVDRDPTHFRYILNHLRGAETLPCDSVVLTELRDEAEFYCMDEMVQHIGRHARNVEPPINLIIARMLRFMQRKG